MMRGCARTVLLGSAVATLAACTPGVRPPPAPTAPAPPTLPAPEVSDLTPWVRPPLIAPAIDPSPWPRLRQRFAMQGCDYRPEVQRWANIYARSPRPFAGNWKQAMPFLLLVTDELERRDLPGEFAMLPFVESSYQPLASSGDRPAGMWQLLPDTARDAGLVIGKDYDGRLDAVASTRAALDLIERYERNFADWRLADMAFNSGEFRVRKLLGTRDAHSLSADDLSRIAFQPGTHEHLDRLLALACIVEDPQRFGVTLPEPTADDRLQSVTLEAGMDLRVAAHLAGVPYDALERWNAGYLHNRMAGAAAPTLLLPSARVERLEEARAAIPVTWWGDWREQRAVRTSSIATWAGEAGVPVDVLAAANGMQPQETVTSSTRLLLPGRDTEAPPAKRTKGGGKPHVHVVASGDTLSRIAHRYDMPLDRLRTLNPRATGTLRLGERLRLSVADND